MADRRIQRDRKGGYELRLPPDERELLRSLPAQFREVLADGRPRACGASSRPPTPTTTRQTTSSNG